MKAAPYNSSYHNPVGVKPFSEAVNPTGMQAASKMKQEDLDKLRKGDHPYDVAIEDFFGLHVPIITVPRPKGNRYVVPLQV